MNSLRPRRTAVCTLVLLALVSVCAAQPFGISSRNSNSSILINDLPPAPGTMTPTQVFSALTFEYPVLTKHAPDASQRQFVLEQRGRIRAFPRRANVGTTEVTTFLDIVGRTRFAVNTEEGLLGLAFDPNFATNGIFYVHYSHNGTNPGTTRISRFRANPPSALTVDPATEEVLLTQAQPYSNHNGGTIEFGPDNLLYICLGDGGSGGDPGNRGQDLTTILGKVLRIDVRGTTTPGLNYGIPSDNPFLGTAGARREIFAYGLRNPYRGSFDRVRGYFFVGDVGQSRSEEIDVIRSGRNYGWKIREGFDCYPSGGDACQKAGFEFPLVAYPRSEGQSVTGGYVYYGSAVPALYGYYIYGDYVTGRIWGLRYDGTSTSSLTVLVSAAGWNISSFGEDETGEVYVVRYGSAGRLYVLRPSVVGGGGTFPTRLSDDPDLLAAGLGLDQTAEGILPYQPVAQLWSDGARKERFVAMPGLDTSGFQLTTGWDFPNKSVIIKNFVLPLDERNIFGTEKRVETRLLYKSGTQWYGFSYEWNEAGTDALLLPDAKQRSFTRTNAAGTTFSYQWEYPSRNQCAQCHTNAANSVLGLNTPQMNGNFTYPASGVKDNQLRTLNHIGFFSAPLPSPPASLPRMPSPLETSELIRDRARAYLHANCAMCHQPGGGAPSTLDLRWETSDLAMNAFDALPTSGDLGITGARIIKPGDPAKSILLQRMSVRGAHQMPPLASSTVDTTATAIVSEWITSISPSNNARRWSLYE